LPTKNLLNGLLTKGVKEWYSINMLSGRLSNGRFAKGHPDYRTGESLKKLSETLKRRWANGEIKCPFKGKEIPHLKKYQFSNGHIPWNKGLSGYKRDSSYLNDPDFKKRHSRAISKATTGMIRLYKRGVNSNFWKGGVSKLSDRIRRHTKYKRWRDSVFGRDNYTCQKCGKRGGYLEAHHIKPFFQMLEENNIKTLDDALTCGELWNVDNGITLCLDCHHRNGRSNKAIKN